MIAMQKHSSKKGFFLTMMALAILSFMLLTAQVWLQTFEQSDIRAASRFKGESMRIALASISDKSFSDFANASAFFALNNLTLYTSFDRQALVRQDSIYPADPNPGTAIVNKSVYELMYNGTVKLSDSPNGILRYTKEDWQKYTMLAWQEKISKAANLTGFNVSFSPMKNFNLSQDSPRQVRIYFEVDMNISDLEGTMRQSKTLKANSTFSLVGFLDPMVTRNDMVRRNVLRSEASEKQLWFDTKYETPDDVKPKLVGDQEGTNGVKVIQGYGWFSGAITNLYPDDPELNASEVLQLKQYILVDSFNEKMVTYRNAYGAIIVTSTPGEETVGPPDCYTTTQTNCINCLVTRVCGGVTRDIDPTAQTDANVPVFVVNGGAWTGSVPHIKRGDLGTLLEDQQFVLMDAEKTSQADEAEPGAYRRLWDVNALRDMTTCGFYVSPGEDSRAAGIAPSFFQRMIAGVETDTSLRSSMFGIESFVVGQWAGGKLETPPGAHDEYSRLDWEFYSGEPGTKIKSMPGCKYKSIDLPGTANDILGCTRIADPDKVLTEGVGRFRLSSGSAPHNAAQRYGAETIACGAPNSAEC